MYLYRMVVRNLVVPLTYSEFIQGRLEFEAEMFIENQSIYEAIFTFITALLFLAMYYIFSNTNSSNNSSRKSTRKTANRQSGQVVPEKGGSRLSLLANEINFKENDKKQRFTVDAGGSGDHDDLVDQVLNPNYKNTMRDSR